MHIKYKSSEIARQTLNAYARLEVKSGALRTYNPKDVIVTFKGIEIKGFADAAPITVERDEFSKPLGTFTKAAAKGGTATLTFFQNNTLDKAQREWAERNGMEGASAAEVRRAQVREWTFDCSKTLGDE